MVRHFSFFGPANDRLLEGVPDEGWRKALKAMSELGTREAQENPNVKFEVWGADLGEEALDMLSGMTKPDPTARPTIRQVLDHQWWLI